MPELGYVLRFSLGLLQTPIKLGMYTVTPLGIIITCFLLSIICCFVSSFFGD